MHYTPYNECKYTANTLHIICMCDVRCYDTSIVYSTLYCIYILYILNILKNTL